MKNTPDLEIIGSTEGIFTKIYFYLLQLKKDVHTPYVIGRENDDFIKNITRVRFLQNNKPSD